MAAAVAALAVGATVAAPARADERHRVVIHLGYLDFRWAFLRLRAL